MKPSMRLMFVVGTRPEAIKLAPLILEADARNEIEPIIVATGQHREMLEQVLDVFEITPDVDLSIMKLDQNLCHITTASLEGIHKVVSSYNPDCVIVQGDTTTAFTGALAAFYQRLPIVHVEAGLRTFNKKEPFPEEANRCLISQLASFHYAPTSIAKENLLNEGFDDKSILVTGNTAIDALLIILKKLGEQGQISSGSIRKRTILVTAHRRENLGKRLHIICDALLSILDKFSDVDVLFPVHLNPKVREIVFSRMQGHDRVRLVDPLDYVEFVKAMFESHLILTDSGGIQEEAPTLGKPVLVLRDQTERPEACMAGTAELVGASHEKIVERTTRLLSDINAYDAMAKIKNPYGDGTASNSILDSISEFLS